MNSDIGHTLKRNAINIGVNSIVAVLIALISAFFILAFFWDRHLEITHTTIELVCIYIELTAFSIIWNTYDRNTTVNHIIGFGFLIVGIFDVIHVYFHLFLPPGSMAVAQLAPYYSTAGRVAEAILLLAVSFDVLKVRINRWLWIIISLAFTLAASLYIYYSLDIWSYLNINNVLPSVKIVIEYSMLAAYVVCALKLKGQILNREIITYKYIFISVLICIPAGMVAILGNVSFGISGVLEHVLKLCSSYYLYRGLFVSAITYSYEKLEENSEHIESVLNALPIGIITYGADQKVNFANTRFEELMGCSRKFVCGFSPTEII
ncbi:MAG: MASE3 domain-containing protein, partial [Pseudomonadota bacterium]